METLIILLIILLAALNIILLGAFFVIYRFILELREFLHSINHEADKLKADYNLLKEKVSRKSSLFILMLGLLGKRKVLRSVADVFVANKSKY